MFHSGLLSKIALALADIRFQRDFRLNGSSVQIGLRPKVSSSAQRLIAPNTFEALLICR